MAAKRSERAGKQLPEMNDYRFEQSHRKNIPPAKTAAEGPVPVIPKTQYAYNPHLPPTLRFDADAADKLRSLLAKPHLSERSVLRVNQNEDRPCGSFIKFRQCWRYML